MESRHDRAKSMENATYPPMNRQRVGTHIDFQKSHIIHSYLKLAPYPETRPLRFRTLFSHHPCMAYITCIWVLRMVNVGKYTIYGSYGFQISPKFIFWRIVRVTTMTDTAVILWVCITVSKGLFMRPLQGVTFSLDFFGLSSLHVGQPCGTLTECGISNPSSWQTPSCGLSFNSWWSVLLSARVLNAVVASKKPAGCLTIFENGSSAGRFQTNLVEGHRDSSSYAWWTSMCPPEPFLLPLWFGFQQMEWDGVQLYIYIYWWGLEKSWNVLGYSIIWVNPTPL